MSLASSAATSCKASHSSGLNPEMVAVSKSFLFRVRQLPFAVCEKFLSHFDPLGFIHVEKLDRRTAYGCHAENNRLLAHKMVLPILSAGIEDRHNGVRQRIDARQVWTFVGVAVGTGKGQIAFNILTSMLFGPDMLNVKGEKSRRRLRQQAVFAALPGALSNELP